MNSWFFSAKFAPTTTTAAEATRIRQGFQCFAIWRANTMIPTTKAAATATTPLRAAEPTSRNTAMASKTMQSTRWSLFSAYMDITVSSGTASPVKLPM